MKKLLCILTLALNGLTSQAQQSWGLDTCFGVGGLVTTGFGYPHDYGLSILLQDDGKIVGAGVRTDFDNSEFAMVRYNSDGTIDESFGTNGKVTYANGGAESAALQPDQKIILSGYSGPNSGTESSDTHELLRFNTDGSLDTTFGVNGRVSTSFGEEFRHNREAVLVLPDGKILQTGTLRHFVSKITLARFESDGGIDSTFGINGSVVMELPDFGESTPSIRMQGDKIIVGGRLSVNSSLTRFMLLRFGSNGTIDSTFGVNGISITEIQDAQHILTQFEVLEDGKLLVTGRVDFSNPERDFWLLRFNENGTLDTSFGTNGMVSTDFGYDDVSIVLIPLSDGNIIVAGWVWEPNNYCGFGIARYDSNGTLNPSFGIGGKMVVQIGPKNDYCLSGTQQSDGKILLFGDRDITESANDFNWDFTLVRLSTEGCGTRTDVSTSIDDIESFHVSPNPATNSVHISCNWVKNDDNVRLTIINSVGQVVAIYHMQSEHTALDVSEFKSGIYILNMSNGSSNSNRKLVIE